MAAVPLPRPRDHANATFRQIVDEVYTQITTQPGREPGKRGAPTQAIGIAYRLPPASIQQLMALLDTLTAAPFNGRADLPHLAAELFKSMPDPVELEWVAKPQPESASIAIHASMA